MNWFKYSMRKNIALTLLERQIFTLVKSVSNELGIAAYVAGGWVRDKLLGQDSDDIDIALEGVTGAQFVQAIEYSFKKYCSDQGTIMMLADRDRMTWRKIKIILLANMVEIINYYFRVTTTGDENFFTASEIQDVIDHANKIMGTTWYIDLS